MGKIEEIIAARREYWIKQRIIQEITNDRARMSFNKTQSPTKKRKLGFNKKVKL